MISQETLDQIQERVDIVELISAHLPLKRSGRNFRALCPFHHEKTPSFMVSPDKQIFHCFGCGEGGDIFRFVMKTERLEFLDAVRSLAEKTGVTLPQNDPSPGKSATSAPLYEANALAVQFYRGLLAGKEGVAGRNYFTRRGLKQETLDHFQLGYASASFNAFGTEARSKGFSETILLRAGLLVKGEDGRVWDRFRNRLIFPIQNVRSRFLGFGGRILEAGEPKYLNSPETEIYIKGRELYGLVYSGKAIREEGIAILVEGYMDCITLFQEGVLPVVATLGTSLTRDQVRLLKRYTQEVVVVFDPDQAGESASVRGLEIFLEENVSVKVATLPGMDPDDYVRKKGKDSFWKEVHAAKPFIPYQLDRLAAKISFATPEGKAKACQEILPVLAKIENAILRSEYLKELSERLSVGEEDLIIELKKVKHHEPSWEKKEFSKPKTTVLPPAEAMLLRLLVSNGEWISFVKERLDPSECTDDRSQKLLKKLYEWKEEGAAVTAATLAREASHLAGEDFYGALVTESFESVDQEKALTDCIQRIKAGNGRRRLQELEQKIREAESSRQEEQLKKLMGEFLALRKSVAFLRG